MGNMREISVEECNAVFGGADIVVTGVRPLVPQTSSGIDYQAMKDLMGGSYGGYLQTQAYVLPTAGAPSDEGVSFTDEDVDGDGIPNWEEDPMVVNGDRSAPERAMDGYRDLASYFVNYFLYSGVALTGFAGLTGRAGAALAVATTAGFDLREQAIEDAAQALFDSDADDDGVVNGSIWRYGLHPDIEPGMVYYL